MTNYDPLTAHLLSGQATLSKPTHIVAALHDAGVPKLEAHRIREEVWKNRKVPKHCPGGRT